jgi:DNA polymerase III subunit gamma/tau
VKLIRLDELVPIAQLAQWLGQPGANPAPTAKPTTNPSVPPGDPGKKNLIASLPSTANGKSRPPDAPREIDQTNIVEIWGKLRENVGPMLGGNLEVVGLPAIFGPKSLVLRFSLRYTSQYDYCSSAESIKRIQSGLKEITGQEWNLRLEMEPANGGTATGTTTENVPDKAVTYREREQEVAKIPLVSRAMEKMGARLLKMDERFGTSETTSPGNDSGAEQEP